MSFIFEVFLKILQNRFYKGQWNLIVLECISNIWFLLLSRVYNPEYISTYTTLPYKSTSTYSTIYITLNTTLKIQPFPSQYKMLSFLFNLVEHYIPNFNQLNKAKKYEVLVKVIHNDNPEYNSTNTTISIAVQHFILRTKRFSDYSLLPCIVKCFLNTCLTFVHSSHLQ